MAQTRSEFNATGNGNRPVEKVSWTEAVAFCTQLTTQEQAAGRLPAGWAYVLPTESQWEYACRAGRPRRTHGVTQLPVRMRIGTMVRTLTKRWMSDNFPPTHGAFLICTEMSGSGPRTGTRRLIPPATRWWILADRHRARSGPTGWFLDHDGTSLRSASAATTPPSDRRYTLASVLVSNSSSKGREEAEFNGCAVPVRESSGLPRRVSRKPFSQ